MRAVVTGGAGFIGSTLVDRLLAESHDVVVIDNLSTGSLRNLECAHARGSHFSFHQGDVRDPAIMSTLAEVRPDTVFHLAAQADVRVSVANPAFDATVNIIGTINVLEGSRRAGARKVVLASSGGTIYGEPAIEDIPLREDAPRRPIAPYGIAKEAASSYLAAYRSLHGLAGTALALANVYGPRQDTNGEAGVVAIFAGRLLAGKQCTIYGSGEQTRDFVFVDDVVDAFVNAASSGDTDLINIGSGCEVSINELHRTMADSIGSTVKPRFLPTRVGELSRNCLDVTRAKQLLGWSPRTPLATGIGAVLESLTVQSTGGRPRDA